MSWLCRLGLHRWRRVLRYEAYVFPISGAVLTLDDGWMRRGRKCQCCGQRDTRKAEPPLLAQLARWGTAPIELPLRRPRRD